MTLYNVNMDDAVVESLRAVEHQTEVRSDYSFQITGTDKGLIYLFFLCVFTLL